MQDNSDKEKKEHAAELRREARIKIIKFASVGIAIAIVMSCYAYTQIEDAFTQIALYALASFICAVASLFIMGAVAIGREEKNKRNFFLYDRRSKTNMPASSLTVGMIREKLLTFMSIFKRRGRLYVGDLFEDNPTIPEHFKPLFCYEILYELATDDGMDAAAFLAFGDECADIFSRYLRENEDYELATSLRIFILDYSKENNNTDSFREYIKAKKGHIEDRMLKYTVKNIEKFN